MAFSPDGRTLATTGYSGAIATTLWDTEGYAAPKFASHLATSRADVLAVSYSLDGSTAVTADRDGVVRTWDITELAHPVQEDAVTLVEGAVSSAAFSRDGRVVAMAGKGHVTLWGMIDSQHARALTTFDQDVAEWPERMRFSPDGNTLAILTENSVLALWDIADRVHPTPLVAPTGSEVVVSLPAFSPDGRTLATSDVGRTVTLWNMVGHSAPLRLAAMTDRAGYQLSMAFSPDGRTLASSNTAGEVVLWDVSNRSRPHRLDAITAHVDWVGPVQFSPDGRTLASVDQSKTVRLWDIADSAKPVPIADFDSGELPIIPVFDPKGRSMALFGIGSSVAIWDLRNLNDVRDDPAGRACSIIGRGLTADEWSRYVPELPYKPTCVD